MGKVTSLQYWSAFFVYIFATTIAFLIGGLGQKAQYDGWIVIVLGAVCGTAFASIFIAFARKRPGEYLGNYGKDIIGKYPHLVVMLLISLFHLHLTAYIIREFLDFFSQTYLRDTPEWAISILFSFALFTLVQTGCSGIFRFAQGVFIFIGLLFFLKPLLFLDTLDIQMFRALVTLHDAKVVWNQTYLLTPWYGELFMVALFLPELDKPLQSIRMLWFASAAGTYILLSEYFLILGVFGPELSGILAYPALELARLISIGDFLQNLDPFIVSIWILSLFIKLSILFYTGALAFAQAISLPNYKLATLPLTALVVTLSLAISQNQSELSAFFNHSWATFAWFIEGLPFIYIITYYVKRRYRKQRAAAGPS